MNETCQLFVYGTLKPGYGNFRAIESHVISIQSASLQGILVDLGAFPAMLHGDGTVEGVLLEIEKEAIRITDHIEGYSRDRDHCLYLREKVSVTLEDQSTIDAWTYFFVNPDRIAHLPRCIISDNGQPPIFAWNGRR